MKESSKKKRRSAPNRVINR